MVAALIVVAALLPSAAATDQAVSAKSMTVAPSSEREKAGLHGPVKEIVEETTVRQPAAANDFVYTITTDYDESGRAVKRRQKSTTGPESVSTKTYNQSGRLLKRTFKSGDGPEVVTEFNYDSAGRLTGTTTSGKEQTEFAYDDATGTKIRTEQFPNYPRGSAVGYRWADSEVPFMVPPGGTLVTTYDEQDRPAGAEIRNSAGETVGKIIRERDAAGRIQQDRYVLLSEKELLPDLAGSELNPEQQKAVATWAAIHMGFSSVAYRYDRSGRMTEKRLKFGNRQETTTFTYNPEGDVSSERPESTVLSGDAQLDELGNIEEVEPTPSQQPSEPDRNEVRHEYTYDSFGNWTEHKVLSRSSPADSFTTSRTIRRTITYF